MQANTRREIAVIVTAAQPKRNQTAARNNRAGARVVGG
jgi:hypothetical protein